MKSLKCDNVKVLFSIDRLLVGYSGIYFWECNLRLFRKEWLEPWGKAALWWTRERCLWMFCTSWNMFPYSEKCFILMESFSDLSLNPQRPWWSTGEGHRKSGQPLWALCEALVPAQRCHGDRCTKMTWHFAMAILWGCCHTDANICSLKCRKNPPQNRRLLSRRCFAVEQVNCANIKWWCLHYN